MSRSRAAVSSLNGSTSRAGRSPAATASMYAASRGVFRQRSPFTVDTAPIPMPR